MSCLTWPCFWYTRSQSFHWYRSLPNQLSNYMRETRDVDIGKHWHLAQTMRMMLHFMMIQDYFLDHFWISYASMMILCGRCIVVGRGISSLGKWIWQYQDFVAYVLIDRLWKHHPEIIRAELMQLLHNYASQTTYVADTDMELCMMDSEVVAALTHEPAVSQVIFKIMTELLLEYGDWRIYRAWRHLVSATHCQVRRKEELRIVYKMIPTCFSVCTSWSGIDWQKWWWYQDNIIKLHLWWPSSRDACFTRTSMVMDPCSSRMDLSMDPKVGESVFWPEQHTFLE